MESLIGLASVVILVLEGFELFKTSDKTALGVAIGLGIGYALIKLFKTVGKKLDCYPFEPESPVYDTKEVEAKPDQQKSEPTPEPEPEAIKPKKPITTITADISTTNELKTVTKRHDLPKTIVMFRDYSRPQDEAKRSVYWIAYYFNSDVKRVSIICYYTSNPPSTNELNDTDDIPMHQPQTVCAHVVEAVDRCGNSVKLPDIVKSVFLFNSTLAQAGNTLMYRLNQHLGEMPLNVIYNEVSCVDN